MEEKKYLIELLNLIIHNLGWGESASWTNSNYRALSDRIYEKNKEIVHPRKFIIVYLVQKKILNVKYDGELGEIVGIEYLFKGHAGVDKYSLRSNTDSTKSEGEDF